MRVEANAVGAGFLVFLAVVSPIYVAQAFGISVAPVISELASWLPYIAAFLSGLAVAYRSRHNEMPNGLLLGLTISLFLGATNYWGPFIGIPSDLPGAYYSIWLVVLSLPVVLFLVVGGIGSKGLWRKVTRGS